MRPFLPKKTLSGVLRQTQLDNNTIIWLVSVGLRQFIDEYIDEHIKRVFDKTSSSIGLVCKLRNFPSIAGPHLDYGDIISDKSFTGFFQKKLESI